MHKVKNNKKKKKEKKKIHVFDNFAHFVFLWRNG